MARKGSEEKKKLVGLGRPRLPSGLHSSQPEESIEDVYGEHTPQISGDEDCCHGLNKSQLARCFAKLR